MNFFNSNRVILYITVPFVFLFFLSSCSVQEDKKLINEHEKRLFNDFFTHLLFFNSAIYTLAGSKPITEIGVSGPDKNAKARHTLSKEEQKRSNGPQVTTFSLENDFHDTWPIWEKKLKKLKLSKYIFVENLFCYEPEPNITFHYFINIENTIKVLQNHYQTFKDGVGYNFEPKEVVLALKKNDLSFWKTLFRKDQSNEKIVFFMGLLFGFGEENSYIFSLQFRGKLEGKDLEKFELFSKSRKFSETNVFDRIDMALFPIPRFISYLDKDYVIDKYKQDRKGIQKIYQHNDFVDKTIELLEKVE